MRGEGRKRFLTYTQDECPFRLKKMEQKCFTNLFIGKYR